VARDPPARPAKGEAAAAAPADTSTVIVLPPAKIAVSLSSEVIVGTCCGLQFAGSPNAPLLGPTQVISSSLVLVVGVTCNVSVKDPFALGGLLLMSGGI